MSAEARPFDQLDEIPVWKDGFDVRNARNLGRFRTIGTYLVFLVVQVVVAFTLLPRWAHLTYISITALCFLLLMSRSKRCWRLRGNTRQLTISKTLGKLGWGRRDFMWAEIQSFETSIGANGFADVMVETRRAKHSLNFELTPEDAEQLAGALTKMRIRAKMDVLARSGYRVVRVEEETEVKVEEADFESRKDTVD